MYGESPPGTYSFTVQMLLLKPLPPPESTNKHILVQFNDAMSDTSRASLGTRTVNRIVAVVSVQVVDFAVEDEPAPGYSLRDAAGHRAEVRGIVLRGESRGLCIKHHEIGDWE
jgi:hypothetical protein